MRRAVDPAPFIPRDDAERNRRTEEIIAIQTSGLVKRLSHSKLERVVIGLSGGLDSTLALLIAVRAFDVLGLPRAQVQALTMPGFGTSSRTRANAERLAEACGVTLETVDITDGCRQQFRDIGHDEGVQDVTFENVQARYRTMILMNKANQLRALVVGTGDLSEIALGWNTYNGDHMSHYNVNAGVPKTLVRHLVGWVAVQPAFAGARAILDDILNTPISPELLSGGQPGAVFQQTEAIIGPYELHDFFLYHFARWESRPAKIQVLAEHAFEGRYDAATIRKWLRLFVTRFFANQWKRSVMPDGPKVGSVALSPRGDWRMPSDADVALWLEDLRACSGPRCPSDSRQRIALAASPPIRTSFCVRIRCQLSATPHCLLRLLLQPPVEEPQREGRREADRHQDHPAQHVLARARVRAGRPASSPRPWP